MTPEKEFYPLCFARNNCQYPVYAEIAIENYYHAKDVYEELEKRALDCGEALEVGRDLDKFAVISVIFSAAAVEAYLNDYAAACIGDEDFYENFDKLSVLSKLQLIAQFIVGTKIDKGGSLYGNLKALEKHRNSLLHSKSVDICGTAFTYTDDEYQEFFCATQELSDYDAPADLTEYKKALEVAREGIKTLKELGVFFDSNDKRAHAIARLFMVDSHRLTLKPNHPLVQVLQEFQIPTKK